MLNVPVYRSDPGFEVKSLLHSNLGVPGTYQHSTRQSATRTPVRNFGQCLII